MHLKAIWIHKQLQLHAYIFIDILIYIIIIDIPYMYTIFRHIPVSIKKSKRLSFYTLSCCFPSSTLLTHAYP